MGDIKKVRRLGEGGGVLSRKGNLIEETGERKKKREGEGRGKKRRRKKKEKRVGKDEKRLVYLQTVSVCFDLLYDYLEKRMPSWAEREGGKALMGPDIHSLRDHPRGGDVFTNQPLHMSVIR